MRRKLTASAAKNMTERQIDKAVFRGARAGEPRGLSDAFTVGAIASIAGNTNAGDVWQNLACDILAGSD